MKIEREIIEKLLEESKKQVRYFRKQVEKGTDKEALEYLIMATDTVKNLEEQLNK